MKYNFNMLDPKTRNRFVNGDVRFTQTMVSFDSKYTKDKTHVCIYQDEKI